MKAVVVAPTQTLVSFSRAELVTLADCVNAARSAQTDVVRREALEGLYRDLHATIEALPAKSTEVFEAWRDGFSIQLKAISAFGDPADLSAAEVRAKLVPLIEESERL
jgi:hypothetical protein